MAEQKESSVLFSLKELMNLEEDRIKKEDEERKQREHAELQARMDAERRTREEQEAALRAEQERRHVEETRAREEATRLDAIRHGEVEKARIDAENAGRMEAMKRQQAHERDLEVVRQDKHKNTLRIMVGASIFVLLAALTGGGIIIKGQLDKAKQLEAQLNSLSEDQDRLKKQLASATTDEERARIQAQLDEKNLEVESLKKNPTAPTAKPTAKGGGGAVPVPTVKKIVCHMLDGRKVASCAPGDPMCSCD